jgi:predicted ATPase
MYVAFICWKSVMLKVTEQNSVNCTLQPLGASDYLQLSQAFHTILIRDIPQMSLLMKSPARRFITLIDTLYDSKVRLS